MLNRFLPSKMRGQNLKVLKDLKEIIYLICRARKKELFGSVNRQNQMWMLMVMNQQSSQ